MLKPMGSKTPPCDIPEYTSGNGHVVEDASTWMITLCRLLPAFVSMRATLNE